MFVNAVYYPNWHVYRQKPPSSLPLDNTSHVFYAFASVGPDGTVALSDPWADAQMEVDGQRGCLRAFVALKQQYRHLKLVLSVGGANSSQHFAAVAADASTRTRFGQSAHALVVEYGLDGIDVLEVDWEHPANAEQGRHYVQLLRAIRESLPAPDFLLTSALPAGQWALQHIHLGHAQTYLDFVNVMTYDFSGPWVDVAGHHAQLFAPAHPHNDAARISGQTAVEYMRGHGVPAEKLVLGVPSYGRSFVGASGVGQPYSGHAGTDGTFDYCDLPRPGAQEFMDTTVVAASCVGGDGGFVSYDNADSVRLKAAFAVEYSLAGLFYWTGTGDQKGSGSLVRAGFARLHEEL
ncbi:MAG: hypothetical protein M1838_004196 [Thelocarpon superellum]|nr:MAG: hypothetical protein M1838_004196 [Thelocarpon superellum]